MNFIPADTLSLILFSIFSLLMLGIIKYAFQKAKVGKKYYLIFIVYVLALSVLVIAGAVAAHVLPLVPLIFATLMGITIAYACASPGTRIAQQFSLVALVGFQAFRLPLELLLHHWAKIGTVPATMTWTGQNFDIITGILALILAPLSKRYRAAAWAFNIIGFGLLMNVMRVVILSSPFPFAWQLEQPLLLAAYFPYVLIAPLFVAPALFGHIVLFRKLANRSH
jgi:hypothetical protein